jgi:hypothetical protein
VRNAARLGLLRLWHGGAARRSAVWTPKPDTSYEVADGAEAHRSSTLIGATPVHRRLTTASKETPMKSHTLIVPLLLAILLCTQAVGWSQSQEQLGTVNFQNSCSADVQETFQRGVAMLHSFRYGEGEKTLREVLAQDPSCAIATWGIAAILMSNPLAGIGPSKEWAERAQAAIDQGRKIGAKTQRERDYIEAVAAYYEDWANRPERTRQLNRARAFEALAARYSTDDEAQIF